MCYCRACDFVMIMNCFVQELVKVAQDANFKSVYDEMIDVSMKYSVVPVITGIQPMSAEHAWMSLIRQKIILFHL